MKGLARRNTHAKYDNPSTNQSKVVTKVKVCIEDQIPRSEGLGHGIK
jgi:hypothetical protein